MSTKLLTLARDLRRRKARERHGLFVAEGARSVEELLNSPLTLRGVLFAAPLGDTPRAAALRERILASGVPAEEVSSAEFESAAETESPQGVLAVAEVPSSRLEDLPVTNSMRLLVLDAIQDPGNLGTILRTAVAFGVTATFSLPGTVDLWNAKVVRSGMGAHFHHPCLTGTWEQLDTFRREQSAVVWAADAGGAPIDQLDVPARLILVVGNEGAGLSPSSRVRADQLVAVPMTTNVESLNVAVATGILLYELRC